MLPSSITSRNRWRCSGAGGHGAQEHADKQRDDDGAPAYRQRHRQRLGHQFVDRPVGITEGRAQVAVQQAVEVIQVLLPQRQVEVVLGLQVGQHRGGHLALLVERPARRAVQQQGSRR
jgi:hypothetical protein